MSDSPYGDSPAGPPGWTPQATEPPRRPSRVPMIAALVVSIAALALAAAAWFKPTPAAYDKPQYSEQQVAEAKKNLCDAYETVYRATSKASTITSDDPNRKYMIALNIRLTFNTAADYLLAVAIQTPAASAELLEATTKMAQKYRQMVLTQTADAPHDELEALYREADAAEAVIKRSCG